jgi:hypothetical protein
MMALDFTPTHLFPNQAGAEQDVACQVVAIYLQRRIKKINARSQRELQETAQKCYESFKALNLSPAGLFPEIDFPDQDPTCVFISQYFYRMMRENFPKTTQQELLTAASYHYKKLGNFKLTPEGLFPQRQNPEEDPKCLLVAKLVQEFLASKFFADASYHMKFTQNGIQSKAQSYYAELSQKLTVEQADRKAFALYCESISIDMVQEFYSSCLTPQEAKQWKIECLQTWVDANFKKNKADDEAQQARCLLQ